MKHLTVFLFSMFMLGLVSVSAQTACCKKVSAITKVSKVAKADCDPADCQKICPNGDPSKCPPMCQPFCDKKGKLAGKSQSDVPVHKVATTNDPKLVAKKE
ncbi:MAG: hypothetical protein AAF206_12885 [Bacteroidota bacterium]